MLKLIYTIKTLGVILLSLRFLFSFTLLLVVLSCQSLLMAQPVTSGALDNEIYFEEATIVYHEPVDEITSNTTVEYIPYNNANKAKQPDNGLLMIAGAVFFGFITLLFLKIAAKNKVVLLIIGLITLMILNAQAQPKASKLDNQVYFEELPGRKGPSNTYSTTTTMNAPLGPPGTPVPIDSGLAIMSIAGIAIGMYGIYRKKLIELKCKS